MPDSITLQFVLGGGIASSTIAWFSQGHFSHVDAVMPDDSLLGARSDVIDGIPSGVRVRPEKYESWKKVTRFTIPCKPNQYMLWWHFLNRQLKQPYDHLAILAFAVDRDWRDPNSWICSELQSAALEAAGIIPRLYLAANKITPVMCAMVCSAIPGSSYSDII